MGTYLTAGRVGKGEGVRAGQSTSRNHRRIHGRMSIPAPDQQQLHMHGHLPALTPYPALDLVSVREL